MKKKNKRVIPGFGISMGVTLTMVSVIVLIPLATLVIYTAQMSFPEIIATITRGRVLSSFYVSFITAFAASAINAVMGLIPAWVLVRYEFPGKRILDGMIELPFALPTAVAGISLTYLTTDSGWIGSVFAKFGIQIAYTRVYSPRHLPNASPKPVHKDGKTSGKMTFQKILVRLAPSTLAASS